MITKPQKKITIKTEILKSISGEDLADLCNITEEAIKAGGGFGWLKTPPREVLNKYWKGLVVVQKRIYRFQRRHYGLYVNVYTQRKRI